MSEFQKALDKYAKYVIQQSRSNLTKAGKGKGPLYNTLSYKIAGSRVTFLSEKYGIFVDKGVKGNDPSNVSPNARIKGQQAPNSPYKFGSGKFSGSWDDFVDKMTKFAKQKNIRFRDKDTGKFTKGGFKSMGYIIAKNIYSRGIRPTMFFTKPFERGLELYGDDIVAGYITDKFKT